MNLGPPAIHPVELYFFIYTGFNEVLHLFWQSVTKWENQQTERLNDFVNNIQENKVHKVDLYTAGGEVNHEHLIRIWFAMAPYRLTIRKERVFHANLSEFHRVWVTIQIAISVKFHAINSE